MKEIAGDTWRLRRGSTAEEGVLVHGIADADERFLTERKREYEITNRDVLEAQLEGQGIHVDPTKVVATTSEYLRGLLEDEIREVRFARRAPAARLASGFIEDAKGANTLSKVIRYQTATFNRRQRNIETLTALQAARGERDGEPA